MLKELYQLRRAIKSRLIQKKIRNVIQVDPLSCLGAAADLGKAEKIMADSFHLNGEARAVLATKIKEQIVSWLRGLKRPADTGLGGNSKRLKLDGASGTAAGRKKGTEKGKAQGGGKKKNMGSGKSREGGGGNGGGRRTAS